MNWCAACTISTRTVLHNISNALYREGVWTDQYRGSVTGTPAPIWKRYTCRKNWNSKHDSMTLPLGCIQDQQVQQCFQFKVIPRFVAMWWYIWEAPFKVCQFSLEKVGSVTKSPKTDLSVRINLWFSTLDGRCFVQLSYMIKS